MAHLMTFEAALTLYSIKLADAQEILMEYRTTDCTPQWKLHEQERAVAALQRINDRLDQKHISRTKGKH